MFLCANNPFTYVYTSVWKQSSCFEYMVAMQYVGRNYHIKQFLLKGLPFHRVSTTPFLHRSTLVLKVVFANCYFWLVHNMSYNRVEVHCLHCYYYKTDDSDGSIYTLHSTAIYEGRTTRAYKIVEVHTRAYNIVGVLGIQHGGVLGRNWERNYVQEVYWKVQKVDQNTYHT